MEFNKIICNTCGVVRKACIKTCWACLCESSNANAKDANISRKLYNLGNKIKCIKIICLIE